MFQKILVAIDHSNMHRLVFDRALALAKSNNARLMLIHVLSPDEKGTSPMPTAFIPYYYPVITEEVIQRYEEQWEAAENHGLELLRSLADDAMTAGIGVEYSQNMGYPGRIICDLARSWGADVIILGRRGRTGLSELLLGSVSNYVVHHAPCSVLVVQGTLTAPENTESEDAVAAL